MKMKWTLVSKGMRPHDQLQSQLRRKIQKLESHLTHFPQDAVHLQVNLERHPKQSAFQAGLTLHLPPNTLRAVKSGIDPIPAFDRAVKAIIRKIAVLKSDLRHENDWNRARLHHIDSTGAHAAFTA
jgi:ribosome-associated translation inhibitor RaiA